MTKEIQLTQGKVALIDDEDHEWLNKYNWCYSGHGYAYRKVNGKNVYMHTFITGYPMTDHKNRNGLNNQRSNLREATKSTNGVNRTAQKNNKCGFKGVNKNGRKGWMSRIVVHGNPIYLGTFSTPEEAAIVYDEKAREAFGEFAVLNFP